MKIDPKATCPLNNFDSCKQLDCGWFMKVAGTHPNTGETLEDWGCAITWIPVMLIENSRQQNSTASAVESFRNEMVKSNEASQQLFFMMAQNQQKSNYDPLILEN
jgi:hypothetical protein